MKVKELIEKLQAADPSREAEVAINNCTVHEITPVDPGYYDGTYIKVHFDKSARDFYNRYGVTAVERGAHLKKINIRYMDMEEAFLENPEAKWIPNGSTHEQEFLETIDKCRAGGRALRKEIEEFRAIQPTKETKK